MIICIQISQEDLKKLKKRPAKEQNKTRKENKTSLEIPDNVYEGTTMVNKTTSHS